MINLLLALLAFVGPIVAISTIEAKGSKLFTSDGSQFYIKGEPNLDTPYLQGQYPRRVTDSTSRYRVPTHGG